MREFNVTAGDAEYAVAAITEGRGQSLIGTTWQVGVGTYDDQPTSWTTAVVFDSYTPSVARVGMLIEPPVTFGTSRHLWVKATDDPEHFAIRCEDSFDIV